VALCVEGDGTLKERCEMLYEHKRNVEAQIEEMHRHLEKVACKIDCFQRQYEAYQRAQAARAERLA